MENFNQGKYFVIDTKTLSLSINVYLHRIFLCEIYILYCLSMEAILGKLILNASDVISQNSRNNSDHQTCQ